jgi:hypothetical protein
MVDLTPATDLHQDVDISPPKDTTNPAVQPEDPQTADIEQYKKVGDLINQDIDAMAIDEVKNLQAALRARTEFIPAQSDLFTKKLDRCDAELAKVKTLSKEYQKHKRHQSFPAARDLAIRTRLNYVDEPPYDPQIPPTGVYKDLTDNYIYKTPIDNIIAMIASLEDVDPKIARNPSVAHAKVFVAKAVDQQYKATTSQRKLASNATRCRTVYDISDDNRGKKLYDAYNGPIHMNHAAGRSKPPNDSRSHTGSSKHRSKPDQGDNRHS